MNRNTKNIIIFSTLVLIFITIYIIIIFLGRVGKDKVTINYAPSFANLTIDNKRSSAGVHYLKPGIYNIEIKYDNFFTEKATLDTKKDKELTILLKPSSQISENMINNNPKYKEEYEKLISKSYWSDNQKQADKYKFRSLLPIEMGARYTIGYGSVSDKNINKDREAMALYITSDSAYSRHLALRDVSNKLLINPSNIEIIFKNFQNPFEETNAQNQ